MPTGLISTYDLTQGTIVDIDPAIRLLSPTEVPLQAGMGSDGNTVLATDTMNQKKKEWQDDEILTPRSILGAQATAGDLVITVATGTRLRFSTGEVVLLNTGEQARITGYGSTADTLLVTRAYAGTTAAIQAISTDIINLGGVLPEGSDPQLNRSQDRTGRFNLTQIFGPTSVAVSGTEQAIAKYGVATTEFDYQLSLRDKEERIKLEQALIYGVRFDDTGNEWRTMGGLNHFITVNVNSTSTDFATETANNGSDAILDMLELIYNAGGDPNRMLLGSAQKRKVSAMQATSIRLGRMDVGRGQTVEYFDSDFSRVDFVLHRWVRSVHAFLFNRDQATVLTLRPFQFKMLGDTGDSMKGIIVGEKSLKFEADRWAGKFTNLVP